LPATQILNREARRDALQQQEREDGVIQLLIPDSAFEISASDNIVNEISAPCALRTESVYLDDPFILDEVGTYREPVRLFVFQRRSGNHRDQVRDKLIQNKRNTTVIDEILTDKKLEKIYAKINSVCDGKVVSIKRDGIDYQKNGSEKILVEQLFYLMNHIATLQETSLDAGGTTVGFMTESQIEVVNFDKVKDEYAGNLLCQFVQPRMMHYILIWKRKEPL
jgi:hypothetical protein